jgi:tripartite-type tricarboxylate transporter receptor subunit TctC
MMRRRSMIAAAAAAALPLAARAEDRFPSRPIRLIVPFAAGGSTDALSRLAGQIINERLGQPVVVENISGAGGAIGAGKLVEAPADGYTLMGGTPGPVTINPHLMKSLPYDVRRDLAPVVFVGDSPGVLVVSKESPFHSVGEIIAAAKATRGGLTFASAGVGSFAHLAAELFRWRSGAELVHVPYRGTSPAATDVLAGRADFMVENYPSVQPWIASGDFRVLAVALSHRFSLLPAVPTMAEAGVKDCEASSWFGLFARAGAPPAAIQAVNQAVNEGLRTPAVQARLTELGVEATGGTPEAFRALIDKRLDEMAGVVRAAGIQPQ